MLIKLPSSLRFCLCFLSCTAQLTCADEAMVNYEEHIKPLFREHCVACHSDSDKSSGLSLESYAAAMEGGSGGASITSGQSGESRLYRLVNHDEQPTMPPDEDRIDEKLVSLLKTWIDQGVPENSGSKIKRKAVQIASASAGAGGRPEGPPPMPENLLQQTPIYTQRAAAISALAASPWSPMFAVGGQMQVSLYHSHDGRLLGVLPFIAGEPQSITFSRDGQLMLVGGGVHAKSGVATLYNIQTGKELVTVGDELDTVLAADISHDNQRIAIAGPKRVIRIYDTATGEMVRELKKHTDWIYSLRYSPDGILLASGDRSNALVVWESDTGKMYLDLLGHKGEIRSLDWRGDSMVLYSGSLDKSIKMWDMNNGNTIKSWDAHNAGVTAIDVANDGTIASTGKDGSVKLWDSNGNAKAEFPKLGDAGMEVALSVDGEYIAAGDWAGNVKRWKVAEPSNEVSLLANPPTLQMQIASLQTERNKLVSKDTAIDKQLAAIGTLQPMQTQIANSKSEIQSFEINLATTQQQRQQSQQQVESLAAKVKEQQIELNRNQAELDAANKLLVEQDEIIKTVTDQLNDRQEKFAILEVELQKHSAEVQRVQSERDVVQSELATNTEQIALFEAQIQQITDQRIALKESQNGLEVKLSTAVATSQEIASSKEKLQSEAELSQQKAAEIKITLDALLAQQKELHTRQQQSEQAMKKADTELEIAIQSRDEITAELQAVTQRREGFETAYPAE